MPIPPQQKTVMHANDVAGPPPWRLRRRVLPQHADHAGVMWHGAYVAWLEEARVEALAAAGLAYAELSRRGLELPVVGLTIDYRRILRHGDAVEIRSTLLPGRGLRLPWQSLFLGPGGAVAAEARVELVAVAGAGGEAPRLLRRWPEDLARAIALLRAGPAGL